MPSDPVSRERADEVDQRTIGEFDVRPGGIHPWSPLAIDFQGRERREQIN
jgi:hypothetical protein